MLYHSVQLLCTCHMAPSNWLNFLFQMKKEHLIQCRRARQIKWCHPFIVSSNVNLYSLIVANIYSKQECNVLLTKKCFLPPLFGIF
jgi:hypothetical protein